MEVSKGFFTFEKFWEAYEAAWKLHGKKSPFLIHFRIATSGYRSTDNCHPFLMKDGKAALVHNGILWSGNQTDVLSDTAKFVKETQDLLADSTKLNDVVLKRIEKVVGASNKMVILYDNKDFRIVNEGNKDKFGAHWNDSKTIWYSNSSYRSYSSPYSRSADFDDTVDLRGRSPALSGASSYNGMPALVSPISPSSLH